MKPKNGSYPYLRIAKEFNLDYGDVLLINEWYACLETDQPLRVCVKEAYGRVSNALPIETRMRLETRLKYQRDEFKTIQQEGWD